MWSRIKKFFQSPAALVPAPKAASMYFVHPGAKMVDLCHAGPRHPKDSVRHIPGDIKPNHVHLFTLNELEVVIPPTGVFRNGMKIPGRAADEPYRFVASFPEQIRIVDDFATMEGNEIVYRLTSGVGAVVDLIHPDCLGKDLDEFVSLGKSWPTWSQTSEGRNFATRGIFYSLSNPPAVEDMEKAQKRLAGYYADLIARADIYYQASLKDRNIYLPELKLARKHFPTL